jgi:hypothetical protein
VGVFCGYFADSYPQKLPLAGQTTTIVPLRKKTGS